MHDFSVTVLFPIWVNVFAFYIFFTFLFTKHKQLFSKALLDASGSYHDYAKIWFQKQLFNFLTLVILLNLYSTSEKSQSKNRS